MERKLNCVVIMYSGNELGTQHIAKIAEALGTDIMLNGNLRISSLTENEIINILAKNIKFEHSVVLPGNESVRQEIRQSLVYIGEKYKDYMDNATFAILLGADLSHAKKRIADGYQYSEDFALINAVRILYNLELIDLPEDLVIKYNMQSKRLNVIKKAWHVYAED